MASTPLSRPASGGAVGRVEISLACSECEARNYRTTRKKSKVGQLTLKKHCPMCNRHTLHKETK